MITTQFSCKTRGGARGHGQSAIALVLRNIEGMADGEGWRSGVEGECRQKGRRTATARGEEDILRVGEEGTVGEDVRCS